MGFVRKLKMAFGFGDPEMDDDGLEGIDARVTPLRDRREYAAGLHEQVSQAAPDALAAAQGERMEATVDARHVPDAIFDTVVKIFNESLPEFLQSSVDEKSQREYIYEALDASMKSYLDKVAENAGKACNRRYEDERRSMQEEMDELRKRVQKEETDSSESKRLQLSAERQKRALNERIHELEKQISVQQAENEQYLLENKSLLNKLRLSSITGGVVDDSGVAERVAELSTQLEALKAELAQQKELTAKADRESKENLMALNNSRLKITELTGENQQLEERIRQDAGQEKARVASLEAQVVSLGSEITNLSAENSSLREQLADANSNLEAAEKIQTQLDELEEARKRHDSERRQLKDELLAVREEIKRLEKEKTDLESVIEAKENTIRSLEDSAESLRKTIENNLYEHARSEGVLRAEIDRLKDFSGAHGSFADVAQPAPEPVAYSDAPEAGSVLTAEEPIMDEADMLEVILPGALPQASEDTPPASEGASRRKGKRGRKPKLQISAIDETIVDTDWLVSTPPVRKKNPATDTPDEFGYKEPDRKITPDHPAQMSLW